MLLRLLKAPLYKNTGSTARDHLASERTFLAWLRTGLGFVALGIAVERFAQFDISTLQQPSLPSRSEESAQPTTPPSGKLQRNDQQALVLTLLGTGSGTVIYGTWRYFSTMRALGRGQFRPSIFGIGGLGMAVAGLGGWAAWGPFGSESNCEGQSSGSVA